MSPLVLMAALSLAAPPKAAQDKLAKLRLAFDPAASLADAPVGKNGAMEYDLALRTADRKVEVRIALRPHAAKKGPGPLADEVRATLSRLAAGGTVNLKPFTERTLGREFGASEGFTTFVEPKAAGWTDYAHCMMYALRAAGRGDVYVFFLFDDFEASKGPLLQSFHIVKFEP